MVKRILQGQGRQCQADESATSPRRSLGPAELDAILAIHLRAIFADVDRRRRIRRNRRLPHAQVRLLTTDEQLELLHAAESAGRSANA